VNNKHFPWHYCTLIFAIVAYIPLLIVFLLFLYQHRKMGYWPQYAFSWALLWSILAFAIGKLSLCKNRKSAKIGLLLASFPIALFIGFIIAGLIIMVIAQI